VSVEIGMTTTGVEDIVGRARRLEALGYDYIAVGEHVSFNLPTSSPLVTLGAAAAVTSRIKLMTSILLAPVYPAALLAKMGATLDHISEGRFTLGVGVGGENPAEIEACGVPMSQRGRRADDVLDIVRRLWTEDAVDHDGRYATLRGITIEPKPVQHPHPPIWVSGRKDAALRRAARVGDGWLPYMFSPEMISASLDKLKPLCGEYGREPYSIRSGAVVFVSCHRDPAVARQRALDRLGGQYQQDFSRNLDRYVAHGDPERVRARIRDYIDAGVESLFIGPACPEEYTAELEQLLADELIPDLR
jgi:probable F420-dependent oxidoreductase